MALLLSIILAVQAAGNAIAQTAADTPAGAAGQARFVSRSPDGVEFEVTAEGLSAIRVGGRTLASGGWNVFNAEPWFKDAGSGTVKTGPVERKTLEVLGPHQVRVTHAGGQVVTTTDYTFDGEDVTISARIENRHPDEPINVVGFSGLTFDFDRPPEGLMQVQHISYFQAHGLGLCHPSFWSTIGGSYAVDDTIGVGVSPWKTGWTRTLILWDYASWEADQREKSPKRRLIYFVAAPIPARGARTIDLRLRVSPDRDWRHLLAPYREHFQATFGPVRYDADYRWIASDYLNHSQQAVSPTNPYGFHGGHRRLDLREGAEAFCQTLIPALKSHGGQGVILWGQGGDDPRGAMYRPDFDILPPEVERNWPVLARRFHEAGLKLGVATRPADMALRLDWKQDQVIPINADDPAHREMLWRRFQKMIDRGCTLFYLDSFGADLEHVKLMRFLRAADGPQDPLLRRAPVRRHLALLGRILGDDLPRRRARAARRTGSGRARRTGGSTSGSCPGCQLVSRLYQVEGRDAAGLRAGGPVLLSPADHAAGARLGFPAAAGAGGQQGTYLDAAGKWKDRPGLEP